MIAMRREFVILVHGGHGPTHYDVMFERGGVLATWQLAQCPADAEPGEPLPARRLNDHRTTYLDYEGPVSGNRGRVERYDKGRYEPIRLDDSRWELRLCGRRVRGRVVIAKRPGRPEEWTFAVAPECQPPEETGATGTT